MTYVKLFSLFDALYQNAIVELRMHFACRKQKMRENISGIKYRQHPFGTLQADFYIMYPLEGMKKVRQGISMAYERAERIQSSLMEMRMADWTSHAWMEFNRAG